MKYNFFTIVSLMFLLFSCTQESKEDATQDLKEGYWEGSFELQNHKLIFNFSIGAEQQMRVFNHEEILDMEGFEYGEDSVKAMFTSFPTFFEFKVHTSDSIAGFFYNPDVSETYKIGFSGRYVGSELTAKYSNTALVNENVSGSWHVRFRPDTDREFPAIGRFEQEGKKVTGTFLKKSGDTRFLSGGIAGDTLLLSGFDGTTPSLYLARIQNDSLVGVLLSDNINETRWIGVRDDNFKLDDADSLTYLVTPSFQLKVKTIEGADYIYPNDDLKGKVTIIQIMGTWCPNCLDETVFLKELYNKYQSSGLEVIAVAYEKPDEFEKQAARVTRFVNKKEIPYPILIGGGANSDKASKDFDMLNRVSAFPTAIFFNKDGEVVKIHTGFTGPGTGSLYEKFKKETYDFVEDLLKV